MGYVILFLMSSVNWYGWYIKGEKVGYSQVVIDSVAHGYKVSELTRVELSMMGAKRWLKSIAQYKVGSEWELQSFTFELETEAQKILMRGEMELREKGFGCVRGKPKLKLAIKTGGTSQSKIIEAKGKVYPATVLPMLASSFTSSPKEIEIFDGSIQAVNTGSCRLLESQADSIKVEVEMLGATTSWVRSDGVLLSQTQPMGIFVKRESKEEAVEIGEATPEILALYGIKSDIRIENPRDTKLLKLLVKGEFLESMRQMRLGDTLLLQQIGPTFGKSIKEYLDATPFIQCKDKRIVNSANEIIGETRGPWKKARKLVKWVGENVRDMPTVTVPSALDVLETLEGDCGEHSVLFVALARACGIPSQIVVGLAYVGDGFYYHAWAKIWAGRWVHVDPTFGQPIADATHIALAEGELEEQAKIMKLVDQIELKVLEYR